MKHLDRLSKWRLVPIVRSRAFKNMSWLFLLNFSNSIIPYFTFPYVTRIFLPEGYGRVSFALSFVAYFMTFIDYGFDLTGARKTAIMESNRDEISRLYSSILVTKSLFFAGSALIIVLLTSHFSVLNSYRDLIWIFMIMALSHVLIPNWLFHGLQKMKYMTFVSLVMRVIFLVSVFLFVKTPKDINLYAFLHSTSFLLIGIASMILVKSHLKINICKVLLSDIFEIVKDGSYVFSSSAMTKVMGTTGTFVLGLFHTTLFVGYYASISKLNQIIIMAFLPIGQALFPYHSQRFAESFQCGYLSAVKIAKLLTPVFAVVSLLIVYFRTHLVLLFLGSEFVAASDLLIVLAFLPLLSIISNFMGTQILVASGHTREYSHAFIKGGVIQIILYFALGFQFGMWGVASAALLGAVFNLLFLYVEIARIASVKLHGDFK